LIAPFPKLIINAAITGMIPKKSDTPHVPVTAEEIIADAVMCGRAGASIVHLHARDANGDPDYRKEVYAEIIRGIRSLSPDLIICVTTSGRTHTSFEKRSDVLGLEGAVAPDMASLTLGSMNFPRQAVVNAPEMIKRLALQMKERRIIPELEVFEPGMITTAKALIDMGILVPPYYFNLLLGSIYSTPATMFDLSHMVQSLPAQVTWAATGIGASQLQINVAAILMGGNVRVGLEDNIFHDFRKRELGTNEGLIQRIVRLANELGRDIATPREARALMGFAGRV